MSQCNKCGRSHDSWEWLCPTCRAIEEHERVEVETREHQEKLAEEREAFDRERDEKREELLAEHAQLEQERFEREHERLEREQERFEREQEQREAAEEAAERRAEEQRTAWEEQTEARRRDLANAHCLQAERMREQAELKLRAGMVKDAIARLRKALEQDDANYRIYETLSEAYEAAGCHAEWEESVRSRLAWLPHSDQAQDGASYTRLLRDCGKAEDLLRKCRALIVTQAASMPIYAAYGGLLAELAAHRLFDEAVCLLDALPQRPEARYAGLIQGVFTPIAPCGELRNKFTAAVIRIVGILEPFDTLCGLLKQMADAGWTAEAVCLLDALPQRPEARYAGLIQGVFTPIASCGELRNKFTAAVIRIVGILEPFDTLCGLLKQMADEGWTAEAAAIASAGATAQDTLSYHVLAGLMQYRVTSEAELRGFTARLARVPTAERHSARQQIEAALSILESSVGVPDAFRRVLISYVKERYKQWLPEVASDFHAAAVRSHSSKIQGTWPKACGWMAAIVVWALSSAVGGFGGVVVGVALGVAAYFAGKAATVRGMRLRKQREEVAQLWESERTMWRSMLDEAVRTILPANSPFEHAGIAITSVFAGLLVLAIAFNMRSGPERTASKETARAQRNISTEVMKTPPRGSLRVPLRGTASASAVTVDLSSCSSGALWSGPASVRVILPDGTNVGIQEGVPSLPQAVRFVGPANASVVVECRTTAAHAVPDTPRTEQASPTTAPPPSPQEPPTPRADNTAQAVAPAAVSKPSRDSLLVEIRTAYGARHWNDAEKQCGSAESHYQGDTEIVRLCTEMRRVRRILNE